MRIAIALVLIVAALAGLFALSRSRTFQLFGEIVPRVETNRKVVALTFDDGPQMAALEEVLAPLDAHGVKATFFLCGAQIEEHPQAAKKLAAAGHELGNHTYSHERLWFKSMAYIRGEFERTDALLRAAGHSGPIHVRAPYCKKLVAAPLYWSRTNRIHVTFDVEPESDPEIDASSERIVQHVLANARPGSIILLHPWYSNRQNTRRAVPAIIAGLRAKGFAFVTVDELLRLRTT